MSAFLLFQVQPLIAKLILPWFGGSAAVWTSCMLFFQMALLGGYGYAHWLNGQRGSRQAVIHAGLLVVSFLSLPILPSVWWKPAGASDPLLGILGLLTATVGLPYFLLSSTSPLLQTWYSRSNGGVMPYRFFALSNLGSMAGLLAYPVLVEPNLTNRQQAWMWSIGYGLFAVICMVLAFRARQAQVGVAVVAPVAGPAPLIGDQLLWAGLAAAASALLLAVTNHLTQNVSAIPFLWVLPLSLYLLSFILCFDSERWYRRGFFGLLAAVALPGVAYCITGSDAIEDLKLSVAFYCVALFVLFMVCHGELARRRPAAGYLTSFYLMVSVGGAAGGLLIGFAAPYLFNALYDLPVVLILTASLLLWVLWLERRTGEERGGPFALDAPYDRPILLTLVALMVGYSAWRYFGAGRLPDAAPLLALTGAMAAYLVWRVRAAADGGTLLLVTAAGLTLGTAAFLVRGTWDSISQTRVLQRNFYGALAVFDQQTTSRMGPTRIFRHGTIDHGEQFLWPQNRHMPTTYFVEQSGVGRMLTSLRRSGPLRVGIIGLGAGTLTAYARAMDTYRVYEINPLVKQIAETQFTFLKDSPGTHDVVLGDARLTLEREAGPKFDVLIVDAFSGDAIPAHLLTREAHALYWKRLKPDGVLAIHATNRYLTLAPVVALAAAEFGKRAKIVSLETGVSYEVEPTESDWVLVTNRPGFFETPELSVAKEIPPIPGLRMWTDDYSNLYRILK